MIPVAMQPEPATFTAQVRNPGRAFLRHTPRPTKDEFDRHAYWSRCMPELRSGYSDVCAYLSSWIPTQASLDHFLPKSLYAIQAYEWSNYRLAHEKINNWKSKSTGVLDPFSVRAGWFVLDFASFFVNPAGELQPHIADPIRHTISALHLNDDQFLKLRYNVLKDYSNRDTTLQFLQRRYPFIAAELQRQGRAETIVGTIT
ncbi:MAG TPA: hypothetical protein VGH51_23305 [Candidatus Angelobacter sp.]